MLRIADFITPDSKFADGVMWMHDLTAEQCTHEYLISAPPAGQARPAVMLRNARRVTWLQHGSAGEYLRSHGFQAVLLHSLYSLPLPEIMAIPPGIRVFWFAFGYDIYRRPHESCPAVALPLYHPHTQHMLDQIEAHRPCAAPPPRFLQQLAAEYAGAVARVDYFSGVIPAEHALMQARRYFRAQRFDYGYGNRIRFEMMEQAAPYEEGDGILVGNSADPCGNHLDVLDRLRTLDLGRRRVVVPLSYPGNYRLYARQVAVHYERVLGGRVRLLTQWLPLEEYCRVLDGCSVGIFAHVRQQAVGNLILLLWRGARLFMTEASAVFRWYRSLGMHVFSLEHDLTQSALSEPLSVRQRDDNRALLRRLYSQQAALERLTRFYALARGEEA